jgi:Thioredoxin
MVEHDVTNVRCHALSSSVWLIGLAIAGLTFCVGEAAAQSGSGKLALEPVSLPDMALGAGDAPVTIIEYSSMTCSHCALFEQNTFRTLKSKYIDTGAVRFVFREFPIDNNAAGASMLARCIGNGDSLRYFSAVAVQTAGPAHVQCDGHASGRRLGSGDKRPGDRSLFE